MKSKTIQKENKEKSLDIEFLNTLKFGLTVNKRVKDTWEKMTSPVSENFSYDDLLKMFK